VWLFLLVGRVAVLLEDALDINTQFGTDVLTHGPINGDIAANCFDQFTGNALEGLIAKHLDRGIIDFKGIIESNLILGQPRLSPRFCEARISLSNLINSEMTQRIQGCGSGRH